MESEDLHERVWRAMQRAARALGMAGVAFTAEERLERLAEAKQHLDDVNARVDDIIAASVWCSCAAASCPHRGRA